MARVHYSVSDMLKFTCYSERDVVSINPVNMSKETKQHIEICNIYK